jgi:short-subunit dehydrogenase
MNIAIVTGASAGLGEEFARQLNATADLDEIWLIARRADRLHALAEELTRTRARVMPLDLTSAADMQTLRNTLDEVKPQVRWLINNAGFGKMGPFDGVATEKNLEMIDLNVRALTEITQRALPFMPADSQIVQVASSAGFSPITHFAVYAATKAYVVNFSQALGAELRPRGIRVTAVCPGPVDTEFFMVAAETGERKKPPMAANPVHVVRQALRDARKGRSLSVHGIPIRVWVAISGMVPRALVLRMTAWLKKEQLARMQ